MLKQKNNGNKLNAKVHENAVYLGLFIVCKVYMTDRTLSFLSMLISNEQFQHFIRDILLPAELIFLFHF